MDVSYFCKLSFETKTLLFIVCLKLSLYIYVYDGDKGKVTPIVINCFTYN